MIDLDEHGQRVYRPDGEVLKEYLRDPRPVVIIRGPIGSGTSSASCMKLASRMIGMPKWRDGIRRSRWIVVRNTYAELRDTTLETWKAWFPEDLYGPVKLMRPMIHEMKWADVEADVYFIALDSDDDVRKMRSLEITGGWINELEFTSKVLFDEAKSRAGRFPPQAQVDEPFLVWSHRRHERPWRGALAPANDG